MAGFVAVYAVFCVNDTNAGVDLAARTISVGRIVSSIKMGSIVCSKPIWISLNPPRGKLSTGEPDAGNPPVRFGGRGPQINAASLPLSLLYTPLRTFVAPNLCGRAVFSSGVGGKGRGRRRDWGLGTRDWDRTFIIPVRGQGSGESRRGVPPRLGAFILASSALFSAGAGSGTTTDALNVLSRWGPAERRPTIGTAQNAITSNVSPELPITKSDLTQHR